VTLYHVNPKTLLVGECKAKKTACPFGEENHYTSETAATKASESIIESLSSLSKKRSNAQLIDSVEVSGSVTDKNIAWLKDQSSWSKNERGVLALLEESSWAIRKAVPLETRRGLMTKISGLHFAKEMLSPKEREILHMLEKMQKEWLK